MFLFIQDDPLMAERLFSGTRDWKQHPLCQKLSHQGQKTKFQENTHYMANLKHSCTFLQVASSAGESHNYLV